MLRIHTEERHDPEVRVLRLEGKLLSRWVDELMLAWIQLEQAHPGQGAIRVDLNAVSYVDDAGRALLAALHVRGCQLIGNGAFIAAVIDECVSTRPPMDLGKR
jgi:ABC-type transporter Mla MlaB component